MDTVIDEEKLQSLTSREELKQYMLWLRMELGKRYAFEEEVQTYMIPTATATYMTFIGIHEVERDTFKNQIQMKEEEIAEIKRRRANNEPVDAKQIKEDILNKHSDEIKDILKRGAEAAKGMKQWQKTTSPEERYADRNKLCSLLLQVFMYAHEDVLPNATFRDRRLCEQAIELYRANAEGRLERLLEKVKERENPIDNGSEEEILAEIRRLDKLICASVDRYDAAYKTTILKDQDFILNPEAVEKKRKSLMDETEVLKAREAELDKELEELKK